MAQKQLNVRVDETTLHLLEAVAFVWGVSLPDVVRPYLEELARELAGEHAVQTAIRAREERAASQAGKLSSLQSKRLAAGGTDE